MEIIVLVVGLLAGLANILQFAESSQWLRKVLLMNPKVVLPILANLGLLVLMVIGVSALLKIKDYLNPDLSPTSVQKSIRETLDRYSYKVGTRPDFPGSVFSLVVTDVNGINADIFLPKSPADRIYLHLSLEYAPNFQQDLAKLPQLARLELIRDMRLSVSRQGLTWQQPPEDAPFKRIAISDSMTREEYNTTLFIKSVKNLFHMYYTINDLMTYALQAQTPGPHSGVPTR